MKSLNERAIDVIAEELGLPKQVVRDVVYNYFSNLYTQFIRGFRNIKIDYFGSFKKNSNNGVVRSKPANSGDNNTSMGVID